MAAWLEAVWHSAVDSGQGDSLQSCGCVAWPLKNWDTAVTLLSQTATQGHAVPIPSEFSNKENDCAQI